MFTFTLRVSSCNKFQDTKAFNVFGIIFVVGVIYTFISSQAMITACSTKNRQKLLLSMHVYLSVEIARIRKDVKFTKIVPLLKNRARN